MCEFKIIAEDHKLDLMKPGDVLVEAAKDFLFLDRYNCRYQKGDILYVREDGRFGDSCHQKFLIVKVPGISIEEGLAFTGARKRFFTEEEKDALAQRYVINNAGFISYPDEYKEMLRETKFTDGILGMKILAKSLWKLDIEKFPTYIGKTVILTKTQFQSALEDKNG